MKKNYSNEIEFMHGMINKVKSINEMVDLGNDFDEFDNEEEFGGMEEDFEEEEPEAVQEPMPEEGLENAIDQIREIALKGMIKLCKDTENPEYEVLKKIFGFCDKAVEKKPENAD